MAPPSSQNPPTNSSEELYFSNGASVLGGGTHLSVAKAACELLAMAPRFRFVMEQLAGKQRRSSRNVRFDLLTFSGNLTADAPEAVVLDGSDALAPLFFKVHEVITELRLATEAQRF